MNKGGNTGLYISRPLYRMGDFFIHMFCDTERKQISHKKSGKNGGKQCKYMKNLLLVGLSLR